MFSWIRLPPFAYFWKFWVLVFFRSIFINLTKFQLNYVVCKSETDSFPKIIWIGWNFENCYSSKIFRNIFNDAWLLGTADKVVFSKNNRFSNLNLSYFISGLSKSMLPKMSKLHVEKLCHIFIQKNIAKMNTFTWNGMKLIKLCRCLRTTKEGNIKIFDAKFMYLRKGLISK